MSQRSKALVEFLCEAIQASVYRRGLEIQLSSASQQAIAEVVEAERMSVVETYAFRDAQMNESLDTLAVTLGARLARAVAIGFRRVASELPGRDASAQAPEVILIREAWPRGGVHLAALFSQKLREGFGSQERGLWIVAQGGAFERLREQAHGLARAHGCQLAVTDPGATPTGRHDGPAQVRLLSYDGDFGPFEESVRAALPPEERAFEDKGGGTESLAYGKLPTPFPALDPDAAARPPGHFQEPESHEPAGARERISDLGKALELFLEHKDTEATQADTREETKDAILARNDQLKDLLEPMLAGADAAGVEGVDPVAEMLDLPTNVMGDFRLLRCIGEGGMGMVFEAQQLSLDRKIALKVLPPHRSFAASSLTRFRREAAAGARIQHPGIVAVYLVGEHAGRHYIAQELVAGGRNLADRLDEVREELLGSEARPDEDYFLGMAEIFSQIAEAMQAAHEAGVIHRDLKPGNILLAQDGRPKVADFGLARLQDSMTVTLTGTITGSPSYMSPEQAEARQADIDNRTDVYGLGVTMYEALTLVSPFDGKSTQEILMKVLRKRPTEPEELQPGLPPRLARACMKAIEKDPAKRFQSMGELAEELRQHLWEHEQQKRDAEFAQLRRPRLQEVWEPKEFVGTVLDGRFRLESLLGSGGFGAVFRALDERVRLNQDCAIKLFDPRAVLKSVERDEFRSTFQRVSRCRQPSLQRVFDADVSEDGHPYLVLEMLDGSDLRAVLESEGRLEPERVGQILLQVLDALSAAHSFDPALLHLDIKPGNIFVSGSGEELSVTLTDLGVTPFVCGETREWRAADRMSESAASTTAFSTLVADERETKTYMPWRARACTPEYAAPEHCAHLDEDIPTDSLQRLDGRADIYALGSVAFELLTGSLPFERQRSRRNLARLKRTQDPKDVRQMGIKVPRALARFVDGCLAQDRKARFANVAAAREALMRYVEPKWWGFLR